MSSIAELLAQKSAIEKQIAEAQRAEKSEAIAKVKALMAEHGLTMSDLTARSAPAGGGKAKGTGKVPIKYRDPATGDTWTGRGLQPKWLKAALASGRKLSDFAV